LTKSNFNTFKVKSQFKDTLACWDWVFTFSRQWVLRRPELLTKLIEIKKSSSIAFLIGVVVKVDIRYQTLSTIILGKKNLNTFKAKPKFKKTFACWEWVFTCSQHRVLTWLKLQNKLIEIKKIPVYCIFIGIVVKEDKWYQTLSTMIPNKEWYQN
jgi:hypothetical protein